VHFWYSRSEGERHINEATDNYLIPSVTAAHILHAMTDQAAEEKPHFESVAAGLIAAFFAIIAREIKAGNYIHSGPKEQRSEAVPLTDDFSGQVREYIETHCNKRLRLGGLAAHFYISRSQFARRMQHEMGMTFGELLTQIRIERACKMLHETDFTSAAIANSLGLLSHTHFQSLFRSRVGCTPIEYRRKSTSKD
jgi:AraC-like DNA-binding protein